MTCPGCGADLPADDLPFCEACGYDLVAGTALARPAEGRWLSSAGSPTACPGCGGTAFGAEGFCETCGQRRPAGEPHSELGLPGVAGVTDVGKRHHRNEDAFGIGTLPGVVLTVVCDGVSTSTRPDVGSHAAVDAATPAMLDALASGKPEEEALRVAAGAAQAAATLAAGADPGDNPPACTFVSAIVTRDRVTVGWVGDSRAYWLPDSGEPACLTADDSLAGRLAAAGVPIAQHPAGPAGALIRWLGADATDTEPHVAGFAPEGPGRVIVCSDGLFRYRPEAAELAGAAPPRTPPATPLDTARDLVRLALDAGGGDNVTVVLLPFPPPLEDS